MSSGQQAAQTIIKLEKKNGGDADTLAKQTF